MNGILIQNFPLWSVVLAIHALTPHVALAMQVATVTHPAALPLS